MTNEQIKNLLETALRRSKNYQEGKPSHDVDKLVIQVEMIISMIHRGV